MTEVAEILPAEQSKSTERPEINKSLLDKPVLCLLLNPEPVEPFRPNDGLSPEEVKIRVHLRPMFTPLLIADQDLGHYAFEDVELVDFFGPFKVYQPKGNVYASGFEPTDTYRNRESFRDRRKNLAIWCHVPEMDLPLTTEAQEEVEGETDEAHVPEVKVILHPSEVKILRNQLAGLLDQEVIGRVEAAPSLVQIPAALAEGLNAVATRLSTPGVHNTLQDFLVQNLEPLKAFAAKEVARLERFGNDHPEDVFESAAGIEGFDVILEMLKSQSKLLVETKNKLSHEGVMIPFEKFEGEPSYSPNTSLEIRDGELVINSHGNEYKFPLPAKHGGSEVCFKGGLARIVAKIALGEDVSGELPVHDIDLVVFGKGRMSLKEIADKYRTNARDIEKLEDGSYEKYCATRDSTFNEVLVSPKGVFISFNALSSMYQGYTQTADDNTSESLFNKHTFSVYKPDMITGKETATEQFVYVGKERFPAPVALSRMFKLLVDGKCDGIVVPEGIRKTDVGIYWLVMARKIQAEEDIIVREAKMERMLTLAKFVDSPFYTSLSGDQRHDPEAFLAKLKEAYPNFDMEGSLSDKDTIVWIAQKLRNQIIRAYMNSVGQSGEKSLQRKLEASDLDLEVITLPPMEAYGVGSPEKKEMDLREKIKVQKTREVVSIFNKFSVEPRAELKQAEQEIRATIADTYKDTDLPPTDLGRVYYIPANKREEFLRSLREAGYTAGAEVYGASFAVYDTKLSCVFIDENEPMLKTQLSLFEELYHASGLKITGKRAARVGYSVSLFRKDGVRTPTTLLEEGMAGLEWRYYKDQQIADQSEVGKQLKHGIDVARRNHFIKDDGTVEILRKGIVDVAVDFVTLIPDENALSGLTYISSPSSHAGELLNTIVNRCGKEEMITLMRQVRRGDVSAMREVARRIEHTFGKGSYGMLLKTSADNEEEIERLKRTFATGKPGKHQHKY